MIGLIARHTANYLRYPGTRRMIAAFVLGWVAALAGSLAGSLSTI